MSTKPTPDFTQLTATFLDLWQKQLVATFNDPGIVGAMLENVCAHANTAQTGAGYETVSGKKSARTAAASVPQHGNDELRQLKSRVAALEKRIAALESGAKKPSRRAAKTTKRK
jgi:hypothetical protein